MLYLIVLAYWLLCVRICVRLEASLVDGRCGAAICLSALGMHARREYALVRGKKAYSVRLKPKSAQRASKAKKQTRHDMLSKAMKAVLLDALRRGWFERLSLRLSLGDACETAIAAGAARALLCALLSGAGGLRQCDLRVTPDFERQGLYAQADGIFSCQLGDIMLAALMAALRKRARDRNGQASHREPDGHIHGEHP